MFVSRLNIEPVRNIAQEGAALLISVVVLLVLTIIALASTNSNQLQSLMVRNAQLRMETFNASYTEIDAQIDVINSRTISETERQPDYILEVTVNRGSVDSEGGSIVPLPRFAPAEETYMEQQVSQEYIARFVREGFDLTAPSIPVDYYLRISSDSRLTDRPNIRSNQDQVYTLGQLDPR